MPTLTIHRGPQVCTAVFDRPQPLAALLAQAGHALAHPCGGRGVCGKCAVLLEGDVSAPTDSEKRCGTRLSCQTTVFGDASVILPEVLPMEQIEAGHGAAVFPTRPMPGQYGAAIDIGTTTLALRLYDLHSGSCLAVAAMLNPQTTVAADVIGRMDAAMRGGLAPLRASVTEALGALLRTACAQAGVEAEAVESLTAAGNTTMLYLLTGRDPASLSRAPFAADHFFGEECSLLGRRCYLPHCLHAFVGADTACALLACGMLEKQETALLCDIGTNGEIALWHKGELYIASAAAGPAFEGAGISCGCGSVPGAIDRVLVQDGGIRIHTIGDRPAIGLCGSGLVDAAAALLQLEVIDETGAMEGEEYSLAPGVALTQRDVRALQLAKAAIAAGTDSLLRAASCPESEVAAVYLAGGFGSRLSMTGAAGIGLLSPALAGRVQTLGNAALQGAAMLLMDQTLRSRTASMHRQARHVRLDGNAFFSERYVEAMLFGCDG